MGDILSFLVKHWVKYSMLVLMRGIASVYSMESFWRREVFNSLLPVAEITCEPSGVLILLSQNFRGESQFDSFSYVCLIISFASMYI